MQGRYIVNAYWTGETRTKKYISGLHFPGNKKWEICLVEIRGTRQRQSFVIEIQLDGQLFTREEFILQQNEIRIIERRVQRSGSIDISGLIKAENPKMAGANIYVSLSYNYYDQYKTQSVIYKMTEQGISCIENLCLYADHIWEKCEIYVEGYENSRTGYMLTLISNGEIDKNGKLEWLELRDKQSKTFSIEVRKKIPLVVAGYIVTNMVNNIETRSGAVIILTGFYK